MAGMGMQLQQLEQYILNENASRNTDTECRNGATEIKQQPTPAKPGAQVYQMSGPTLSEGNASTVLISSTANGKLHDSAEEALYLAGSRRTSPGLPGMFSSLVLEREGEQLRWVPPTWF